MTVQILVYKLEQKVLETLRLQVINEEEL